MGFDAGRIGESRRHRRAYQPLGDLAWFRPERGHGFDLFPLHRALRSDPAGDLDAVARLRRAAERSDGRVGAEFRARVRKRNDGDYRIMIDVVMPQMGESIVEGTLTKWLKKAGEHVERDEPLFEISTDKVDTEIPSPAAGTLSEIIVEEGKTVGINTVVGRITDGTGAAAAPAAQPAPAPSAPAPAPQAAPQPQAPPPPPPPAQASEPVATVVEETAGPLSPLVRKMARENNIDLAQVRGTGAGARITKQDLENYLAARSQPAPAPAPPQAPPAQTAMQPVVNVPPPPQAAPPP